MSAEPGTRLLEEIVLLLDAVAERLGPYLDQVAAEHDGPADKCPLCAIGALVRGEPNDLAATTLDRAADIVALLRAVLADRWEPGVPHMPGFRPPGRPGRAPEPKRRENRPVQHIQLRRSRRPGND
ncbi:hypothetical protein ALI144C_25625 [Actinosynnema sp. ALI-1.44]|uniref:hypothetical protein n=1 Tax=Actinosynnema sp. ALI-1.44 TaxID=1933779 RepID=UPI00097C5420|nr:hypothetical protein [Actinosynnema sp. ALI-1.44]ONI79216.1 hypothetical protein ALI144C_25625 [Actinosynnema sp. ALI-1.44]